MYFASFAIELEKKTLLKLKYLVEIVTSLRLRETILDFWINWNIIAIDPKIDIYIP